MCCDASRMPKLVFMWRSRSRHDAMKDLFINWGVLSDDLTLNNLYAKSTDFAVIWTINYYSNEYMIESLYPALMQQNSLSWAQETIIFSHNAHCKVCLHEHIHISQSQHDIYWFYQGEFSSFRFVTGHDVIRGTDLYTRLLNAPMGATD